MRKSVVAALLSLALVAEPSGAQQAPAAGSVPTSGPLDAAIASAVIADLAAKLEQNFVDPEIGRAYAAALRANLAAGKYSQFSNADDFAKAVTADLQAVHKDGHLRLFSPAMVERLKSGPGKTPGQRPSSFIEKSGWIAPGVAYISFLAFMGDEPTMAQLREFLASHSDAKTLIIDARHHHGGGMDEMDLLFAQLFAKPTDLLAMDTREAVARREGAEFGNLPTLVSAAAPATVVRQIHRALPAANPTLATAKVLLLTSAKTASAGEHLALALKRTHRATLIGETTHGAGNYGHPFKLAGDYQAFIPFGRTFDPDTGKGWEGVGVAPDVAVSADNALDEALKRAGIEKSSQTALAELR